ncbi:MAG: hypothetical protein LBP79_06670 [Clostridiales bacterium]|jgi:hypothetical protein|nr:hypothetical protein [Clostridiales bacterium]
MDIVKLTEILTAAIVHSGESRRIVTGYCGDFLSFAMGRAPSDSAWFTVMSNVNVAAVALLADVSVVVLCEDVKPDESLAARCKKEGLNIICTPFSAYEASVLLGKELEKE